MNMRVRGGQGLDGAVLDLAVCGGMFVEPGSITEGGEIDATGCTVLPGLHDHHVHLLATAARRGSLDVSHCANAESVGAAIRNAARSVRAVGYDERAAGLLDRAALDRWAPGRPIRVQDRTGSLWVLNSAALDLLSAGPLPAGAERDAQGQPTGRFWREDQWLAGHFRGEPPELTALGYELASYGVTGVSDAGWHNGPAEARILADARISQRLTVMGNESLPEGTGYARGALKLMIDERDPPVVEGLTARIAAARRQHRSVAAHCTTAAELALYLAALEAAGGARHGDRIEHGGVISDSAIAAIASTPLTVVTNPAFVHDRGDRYRATIPANDWPELYRAAALQRAGIPLAAGSDAPYASTDPWLGMRTARDRLTASGQSIGADERLCARAALALYLGTAENPGGPPRALSAGAAADFVICSGTPAEVLVDLTAERVVLTVVAGKVAFSRA